MKYCIDTSSIIHAWIEAYPPDNFPPVWDKINDFIAKGKLISSEEVLRELKKKHDSAYQWAKGHHHIFLPIDEDTQILVAEILSKYKRLVDTKKGRMGADPFIHCGCQASQEHPHYKRSHYEQSQETEHP